MSYNSSLTDDQVQWEWMDDGSNGWTAYSAADNAAIQKGQREGKATVDLNGGGYRQRYRVKFNSHEQVNRTSGNTRPIRQVVKLTPAEQRAQDKKDRKAHFMRGSMAPKAEALWRKYVPSASDDDDGIYWDSELASHGPFGMFCDACCFEPDAAVRAAKDDNGSVSELALIFYWKAGVEMIPPSGISKDEFMTALSELKATDEASVAAKLAAARDGELQNPTNFKAFYMWAFGAACRLKSSSSIDFLPVEFELSACDLWKTLFAGTFFSGSGAARARFRPLEHFISFVTMDKQVKKKGDLPTQCTEDEFSVVLTLAVDNTFSAAEGYDDEKYTVLCDDFIAFVEEHDLLGSGGGGGSAASKGRSKGGKARKKRRARK